MPENDALSVSVCGWVKCSTHVKSVIELFLLLSYLDIYHYMLRQTLAADTTTSAGAGSDITELRMQPMSKENEKITQKHCVVSLLYSLGSETISCFPAQLME